MVTKNGWRTVDSADNLSKEIIDYLTKESFNIFYGTISFEPETLPDVSWQPDRDWKEFLKIAKQEGVETIVVDIDVLEESYLDALTEETEEIDISEFKKYVGKVGGIELSWIKGGAVFRHSIMAKWYEEFESQVQEIESQTEEINNQAPDVESSDNVDTSGILDKPTEDLTNELAEYADKFHSDSINRGKGFFHVVRSFWDEKGLSQTQTFGFERENPELAKKLKMVEINAEKKFNERLREKEKAIISNFVQPCVEWAKEHCMKKLTKGDLDYFLDEKDVYLTYSSRHILWAKVNIELKRTL